MVFKLRSPAIAPSGHIPAKFTCDGSSVSAVALYALPESAELMAFTQQAIRVMKKVSRPEGFNVGLNLGGVAGGSLADHLHQHIVPRWGGDANFITVVGGVKVMPQLLRDTRALLAEAWKEET